MESCKGRSGLFCSLGIQMQRIKALVDFWVKAIKTNLLLFAYYGQDERRVLGAL